MGKYYGKINEPLEECLSAELFSRKEISQGEGEKCKYDGGGCGDQESQTDAVSYLRVGGCLKKIGEI